MRIPPHPFYRRAMTEDDKEDHHAADHPMTAHDAGIHGEYTGRVELGTTTTGSFQIVHISGEPLVTIWYDGRVEVNPLFTVDETAKLFWEAVIRLNPNQQPEQPTGPTGETDDFPRPTGPSAQEAIKTLHGYLKGKAVKREEYLFAIGALADAAIEDLEKEKEKNNDKRERPE
jgi:hypothetical protein